MSDAKKAQLVHLSRLLREAADTIDTLAADQPQPTELKKIYEALDWAGFPVQADVDKATEEDFLRSIQLLSRSRESINHDYEALKVEAAVLRETVKLANRTLTDYGFVVSDVRNPTCLADAISALRRSHLTTIKGQEKRIAEYRLQADEYRKQASETRKEVEDTKVVLHNLLVSLSK